MYPNAVIILNTRPSAESWAKSMANSLGFFYSSLYKYICLLWENDRMHYAVHHTVHRVRLLTRKFGAKTDTLATTDFYHAYNAWVRREAAKRGRTVLEWQAADGYAPLCAFLGRPVPLDKEGKGTLAFPHLNDQRDMAILKAVLIARGLVSWAALGSLLWVAWAVARRGLQIL